MVKILISPIHNVYSGNKLTVTMDREKKADKPGILDGEYNLEGRPSTDEKFAIKLPSNTEQEMLDNYQSKTSDLPSSMQSLVLGVGLYMKKKANAGSFSEVFLSRLPDFYRGIEFKSDKKAYCQNYENELTLISSIGKACYDYAKDTKDDARAKKLFDEKFLENIEKYLSTEDTPRERFLD